MISSLIVAFSSIATAKDIVHDAEHCALEAQHGEQWAQDDAAGDRKLTESKQNNGGKPPNIPYILIADIGFGDLGIPELNAIRGYKRPAINKFADPGRVHDEPPAALLGMTAPDGARGA